MHSLVLQLLTKFMSVIQAANYTLPEDVTEVYDTELLQAIVNQLICRDQ